MPPHGNKENKPHATFPTTCPGEGGTPKRTHVKKAHRIRPRRTTRMPLPASSHAADVARKGRSARRVHRKQGPRRTPGVHGSIFLFPGAAPPHASSAAGASSCTSQAPCQHGPAAGPGWICAVPCRCARAERGGQGSPACNPAPVCYPVCPAPVRRPETPPPTQKCDGECNPQGGSCKETRPHANPTRPTPGPPRPQRARTSPLPHPFTCAAHPSMPRGCNVMHAILLPPHAHFSNA